MNVNELLGWNPLGRRWERELLLSNPLGNLPRRELTSIVVDCLLQSIVAQALGELIHHVLLEKIQKLGPATLLFRHGSSRVIRFCFSGWIFALSNDLARWWASTRRAEPRHRRGRDTSVLNLVYNLADYVNEIAFCLAGPPTPPRADRSKRRLGGLGLQR